MGDLDDGLAVSHLGRVNRGVEEIERHAFPCQGARGFVREAARVGELVVDVDEPLEPVEVGFRAEGHQHVGMAVRRRPARLIQHAVRVRRQVLHVVEHLRVAGQLAVGADLEAEVLGGRLDGLRRSL